MDDGLSTDELVMRMRASGLDASRESLRKDVERGLLSPRMPSTETPGRGTPARWSPMSVRRARRMARLRKHGVNGHVLPLLLFLDDGWGWAQILPDLQAAAAKSWALDRAQMNQPTRVKTAADLRDNAQQTEEWAGDPRQPAIADFRTWRSEQAWFGQASGASSPVPFLVDVVPSMLGRERSAEQRETELARAAALVQWRAALHLPGADVGAWLARLDPAAVERGRVLFWQGVQAMRRLRRTAGLPGSNPLTLGGLSPAELAAFLRGSPGRFTPAQVLGGCIAQAMATGVGMAEMGPAGAREP